MSSQHFTSDYDKGNILYKHFCLSPNGILRKMFYFTSTHNYANDNMLKTAFLPQCLAVDLVYHLLDDYVA